MTKRHAGALAFACLIAATVSASAQTFQGFKSPSGNILCAYSEAGEGLPASLRCDILRTSNKPPAPPRDCQLDYGNAFEISKISRGARICHGDTVAGYDYRALPYGEVWKFDGFTCFSAESGITCRNEAGGGFELSRARQRVF